MRPIVISTTDASGGATFSAVAPLDIHGRPEVSLELDITGTATCTVQLTNDDVFDSTVTPVWFSHPTAAFVGATADQIGSIPFLPRAVRLTQTAGNGSARLVIVQAGILG